MKEKGDGEDEKGRAERQPGLFFDGTGELNEQSERRFRCPPGEQQQHGDDQSGHQDAVAAAEHLHRRLRTLAQSLDSRPR
jgi:hypothetical protein